MKELKFNDASTLQVEDSSSISNITVPCKYFMEVQTVSDRFTEDNIKHCTLDGTSYNGIYLNGVMATKNDSVVLLTITTRTMSDMESLQNQIAELQEAVTEIAGGTN